MKHDQRVFEVKVKSDHRSKFFLPSNCLNWKKITEMITLHFHLQPQYYIYFTSFHCTGRYEFNKLTSLPMCGSIAQLVEHRSCIAEVTASNPVEALIFSGLLNWKKFTAMITLHFHLQYEVQYEFHIYFSVFEVFLNDKLILVQMFLFPNNSGSGKNLSDLMGHLPNNCIELLCWTQLVSEASFPFTGHKMPINMCASLKKGELREVMESIGEVEKCLGKILELKEAYKNLDKY